LPIGVSLDLTLRLLFLALFVPAAVVLGAAALTGKALALVLKPFLWAFDRAFTGFQKALGTVLRGALRARGLTLLVTAVAAGAAALEFPKLKQDLMPAVKQGLFYAEVQLDVGTSIDRTDERAQALEAAARRDLAAAGVPLASVSTAVGVPRDAIAKPGDGPHTARLYFQLRTSGADLESVETRAREVVRRTFAAVPGVGVPVVDAPQLFQATRPLEVEVAGDDAAALREAATLLEREVAAIPGVTGTRSTVRRGRPEIVVRPDREAMARYDLKLGDVANLLRAKVQGQVATYFSERDRKIEVRTRLPDDELRSTAAVANLQVNPGRLPAIPLSAVARVEVADGPSEIRHVAGRRAEIVSADLAGLDLRGAGDRLREILARAANARPDLFRKVAARIGGQNEESAQSTENLLFALYLAVFLVYLVMAAQFESLVHPLVIMFSLPLALIGVVFVLSWTGTPISVIVFIGVILLAGIVVNNAIILVDTVNRLRREGLRRDAALLEAAQIRLRPIAMTTGTTVLGLLPLALGLGEGAEIRQPMAITVIAGLSASTLLTLVVIPVVYSLVSRPGALAPEGAAGEGAP
jgi:HAE1 family hydrophobic/amphiphilic exporter-1